MDEGLEEFSPLRIANIAINVLLGGATTGFLVKRYWELRKDVSAKRRQVEGVALRYLNFLFVALMVNNALRSSHMVDHTIRPVYYHEPRWAYAKVLITELELATYANILIALLLWQGAGRVLTSTATWDRQGFIKGVVFMTLYIMFGCLFGLIHYTVEPPCNYGPFPNMNIGGTALTTIPVAVLLVRIYLQLPQKKETTEGLTQDEKPDASAAGQEENKDPC